MENKRRPNRGALKKTIKKVVTKEGAKRLNELLNKFISLDNSKIDIKSKLNKDNWKIRVFYELEWVRNASQVSYKDNFIL